MRNQKTWSNIWIMEEDESKKKNNTCGKHRTLGTHIVLIIIYKTSMT